MSFRRMGNSLPNKIASLYARQMTAQIAAILRARYPCGTSAIKRISRDTGVGCHTVKKWYEGRNAPDLGHFLLLQRHYPEMQKAMERVIAPAHLFEEKPDGRRLVVLDD